LIRLQIWQPTAGFVQCARWRILNRKENAMHVSQRGDDHELSALLYSIGYNINMFSNIAHDLVVNHEQEPRLVTAKYCKTRYSKRLHGVCSSIVFDVCHVMSTKFKRKY
jgi:hypothetical protein